MSGADEAARRLYDLDISWVTKRMKRGHEAVKAMTAVIQIQEGKDEHIMLL